MKTTKTTTTTPAAEQTILERASSINQSVEGASPEQIMDAVQQDAAAAPKATKPAIQITGKVTAEMVLLAQIAHKNSLARINAAMDAAAKAAGVAKSKAYLMTQNPTKHAESAIAASYAVSSCWADVAAAMGQVGDLHDKWMALMTAFESQQ